MHGIAASIQSIQSVTSTKGNAGVGASQNVAEAGNAAGPSLIPPTNSEIKAFSAAKSASVPEIGAQAPQQPNRIMADLSDRLNSLAANYNAPPAGTGSDAATSKVAETHSTESRTPLQQEQDNFKEMFNRFQDMQMFTVRANLITNGASSSTHTFNSLLKGQ